MFFFEELSSFLWRPYTRQGKHACLYGALCSLKKLHVPLFHFLSHPIDFRCSHKVSRCPHDMRAVLAPVGDCQSFLYFLPRVSIN